MPIQQLLKSKFTKPLVFMLCLLPMANIVWRVFFGDLGANPVETITFATGDWTLRFLLITLAISSFRQWFGLSALPRFRRMLGLYVFFYACCHFLVWFVADHSFDITSNNAMMRKLGRRWKKLHRSVYLIVILGVLHYLWLVKADYLEPGIYAFIAAVLLFQRLNIKKWWMIKFSQWSENPT